MWFLNQNTKKYPTDLNDFILIWKWTNFNLIDIILWVQIWFIYGV